MEKTKSGIKKMLKEQYKKGCNGYLCELKVSEADSAWKAKLEAVGK